VANRAWVRVSAFVYETVNSVLRPLDRASLIYFSEINKMQRYTMVFIPISVLHLSGGSSAHHQKLKTVRTASGIVKPFLLLTAIVSELFQLTHDSGKKQ
jgi:hypothetical protein